LQPAYARQHQAGHHGPTDRVPGDGVTLQGGRIAGPFRFPSCNPAILTFRVRQTMDANDLKGLHAEVNKRMSAAIEHRRHELAGVRTGRASVAILDSVHVEAYGARMPLNQLAGLSVPEPTLIVAQPFDPSQLAAIEKAIRASDLGLNPSNDGKVVRVPIPPLTEER